MKIPGIVTLLVAITPALQAQTFAANPNQANLPAPAAYRMSEQGANYNVWQRKEYESGPNGTIIQRIHSFTELASGLNFLDENGKWQPSKEEIDILPDGTALASRGQHQVLFPGDIYNGEIVLRAPGNVLIKSQPIALGYDDGKNTVLIAVLTNSIGQLVSTNQIVYPNAFVGINADLRLTYRRSGLEQDVILHSQPPAPESLGLNPQDTKLEMMTEFIDSPTPRLTENVMAGGSTDENVDFGIIGVTQLKLDRFCCSLR